MKKSTRTTQRTPMVAAERKAVASLALLYGLRMFGLFMLLPVLTLQAAVYADATPFLIGITLGIYGLTQALLQIPFGLLSDRIGRKQVIALGLVLFAVGSVVAALSDTLLGVLMGRAIQGAGAVSSAIMALTADVTREEQRTKAMAIIGMSIGLVFLLSLLIAPPLSHLIGLSGLFTITAGLALLALLVLWKVIPAVAVSRHQSKQIPLRQQFGGLLKYPQLMRLNFAAFCHHFVLTAMFTVLPLQFVNVVGIAPAAHWQLYLPIMLIAVLLMLPLLRMSSANHRVTGVYRIGILLMAISLLLMAGLMTQHYVWLLAFTVVYFAMFNLLEAMLPSLISRVAPGQNKGGAMGIYHSIQFTGFFLGGSLSGLLQTQFDSIDGARFTLLGCAILLGIWWFLERRQQDFRLRKSRHLDLSVYKASQVATLLAKLEQLDGVQEVTHLIEQQCAYLVLDESTFDQQQFQYLLKTAEVN